MKLNDFEPILWKKSGVLAPPKSIPILDLTKAQEGLAPTPSIGRYNEVRKNIYTAPQYQNMRTLHLAYDFFMPAGTPVYAVRDARIFAKKYRSQNQDYGYTVILEINCDEELRRELQPVEPSFTFAKQTKKLYLLYGHLGLTPAWTALHVGDTVYAGDCLGHLGVSEENGGWPEHLHLQLSTQTPVDCDMLGVVDPSDAQKWREIYPDPAVLKGVKKCLDFGISKTAVSLF